MWFALLEVYEDARPPSALPRWRRNHLAIWTQWQDAPIRRVTHANDEDVDDAWPEVESGTIRVTVEAPTSGTPPDREIVLHIAFVDPAGRPGPLLRMAVG
jgi:hypothetical protein